MRSIPPALQAYMDGRATGMTWLVKLGPLLDGSYRYWTMLDRDVVYDPGDGTGEQTWIARVGASMSAFATSADLGVDNAELDLLPPVASFEIEGITEQQIQSGELDSVRYRVYCLSFEDTSLGHFIWAAGTIGEQRIRGTRLVTLEQRSISNRFKQTILDVDSTTCRVKHFGSQPIGTGGGVPEERFSCEYDLTGEWVSGTVTAADPDDPDLVFTDVDLLQSANYFAPGLVRFTSGANAGIEREISAFDSGQVTLNYPTPHPIAAGDEFDIRRDCTRHKEGHNGCKTYHGADWNLHFRGEPAQPVGDTSQIFTPGAGIPGDTGGTGEMLGSDVTDPQ